MRVYTTRFYPAMRAETRFALGGNGGAGSAARIAGPCLRPAPFRPATAGREGKSAGLRSGRHAIFCFERRAIAGGGGTRRETSVCRDGSVREGGGSGSWAGSSVE